MLPFWHMRTGLTHYQNYNVVYVCGYPFTFRMGTLFLEVPGTPIGYGRFFNNYNMPYLVAHLKC